MSAEFATLIWWLLLAVSIILGVSVFIGFIATLTEIETNGKCVRKYVLWTIGALFAFIIAVWTTWYIYPLTVLAN